MDKTDPYKRMIDRNKGKNDEIERLKTRCVGQQTVIDELLTIGLRQNQKVVRLRKEIAETTEILRKAVEDEDDRMA